MHVKKRLGIVWGAVALIALVAALATSPSARASTQPPVTARAVAASHAGVVPDTFITVIVLKNVLTGRCMDDSQAFGLRMIGCNGTLFQDWRVDAVNSIGIIRFQNEQTSACMVEVPGVGLKVAGCNPSALGQRWTHSGTISGTAKDIFFINEVNGGLLTDMNGPCTTAGTVPALDQEWNL